MKPKIDFKFNVYFTLAILFFVGFSSLFEPEDQPVKFDKLVDESLAWLLVFLIAFVLTIYLNTYFFKEFWNRFLAEVFDLREVTVSESYAFILFIILIIL